MNLAEIPQHSSAELETLRQDLAGLSYAISHDVRAPLRIIDGFCGILIEDYASQLAPEAQGYLQAVLRNTHKMGQLIEALLHFLHLSRQPLTKRWVHPTSLVHQTLRDVRRTHVGRHVEVHITELPACLADPALLTQLLVSLLSNALKYTRQRAVAQIDIGVQDNTACPDAPIYFVKDNGVGFDMQYAEKLFGMFQRLHQTEEYEGIGMGLALAQGIVHRHGGRIWADAEVNRGATFYFTLGGETQHAA